jgi:acyl carrier protein
MLIDKQTRIAIREFVRKRLNDYGITTSFTDSESLINSGLLDSLALIHLIMFMEQKFSIDFIGIDFDPDNFDSIDAICQMLKHLMNNN